MTNAGAMLLVFVRKLTRTSIQSIQSMSTRMVLGVGFGLMLSLVGLIGALAVMEQDASAQQFSRLLAREMRAAELGQKSVTAMAAARRFEKDFLIFNKEIGFAEAKSRYVMLLQANLADAREALGELDRLLANPVATRRIQAVTGAITAYESAVLVAVDLQGKLGFFDTGLEGQFRTVASQIESLLKADDADLMVDFLSVRRHEKDYLLRGREVDSQATDDAVAQLIRDIGLKMTAGARPNQLVSLARTYQAQFDHYVETDNEIEGQRRKYRAAVQKIEPALQALLVDTQDKSREMNAVILHTAFQTEMLIGAVFLACILLGTFISCRVSRRITRGVKAITAFAQRLAKDDFVIAGRWTGNDEFSVLGRHLCQLANALQTAANLQRERTEQLERFNLALQREVAQRTAAEVALHHSNVELENRVLQRTTALAASEERFRRLADMSSDWYWQQDENFRFTEMSGGMVKKNRVAGTSYIGKTRWEMPIELTPEQWADHKALLNAHRPFSDMEFKALFENVGEVWFSISGEPIFDENGRFTGYRGVGKDISERKQTEQRIRHLSLHDGLTGMPNRALLFDRLTQALTAAARYDCKVWVGFIDLDAFKPINDLFGHDAGDIVLQTIAKRLQSSIRDSDTVARLGGDEFVIVLPESPEREDMSGFLTRMMRAVALPISVEGRDVSVGCSIGVAAYPAHGSTAEVLINHADAAMYCAKKKGRNNWIYYEEKILENQ